MAKKTEKRRVLGKASRPRRTARLGGPQRTVPGRLRDTWDATLSALTSAEENLEQQIRRLLKRSRISTKDASAMLKDLGALVGRERRKALQQLDARLKAVQARLRQERKQVSRTVQEAVQSTLAAVNIPSRHEVHELTRKVDELSRKIDRFKR